VFVSSYAAHSILFLNKHTSTSNMMQSFFPDNIETVANLTVPECIHVYYAVRLY